ncbi:MAG TPA: fructosamine kinase family protein [Burkholderiaceae bacterium]
MSAARRGSGLDAQSLGPIEAALRESIGPAARVERAERVGVGGSGAAAYRIDTTAGPAFLKIGQTPSAFDVEAAALAEIASTGTLRVPKVLGAGAASAGGFLLLEWIEFGDDGDWRAAGERLAALHAVARDRYGWPRDGTLGATPQLNAESSDWCEFYRTRRLEPQLRMAGERGLRELARRAAAAERAASDRLSGYNPPASLLHGDLWRGNLAFDIRREPVVFDPATYYGAAETDLAMTRLFGGFPREFYEAYDAARPPDAGRSERLSLYQLYHVLNHANLFGGGYVAQACAMIDALAQRPRP